jgi:hypothetical protein
MWLTAGVVGVLVVEGAIFGAVALATATHAPPKPTSFTLRATMELDDSNNVDDPCNSAGGYADIATGAEIVVANGSGQTLALGELGEGIPQVGGCVYNFTVKNVPGGKKFYGVEVSHRGFVQESESNMRAGNVHLSLGS